MAVTSEGDNLYELNDPSASEQELRAREKRILDGVYQLLAEIKNSTKDCPPSFGLLFKHLKLEVSKKFLPTSLDPYSIMSSFFFLRLLIPAIVQPQRYNLLNDVTISPGSRRGLMLISKILINMANGIVFNEEKMKVFNEAIAKNVPTLHSIFDEVMLMAEKHRGSITERGADSGESTGDDLSVDDVDSISQKD